MHCDTFTKYEISKIKELLDEKIGKTKSEQLKIRNTLHDTYGFYISDFSRGNISYTSDDFQQDIEDEVIGVCRLEPEFDKCVTGRPKDVRAKINIAVGQYLRNYNIVKVGITNNPYRRFGEHLRRNPECRWDRMIVKYSTSSLGNANDVEDWFIANRPELYNKWKGWSHMSESDTYYLYFLLGDKIENEK